MKRCPQCGRDYNDDSLSFCLDDGSDLLFGPVSIEEPATALLSSPHIVEAGTRRFSSDDLRQTPTATNRQTPRRNSIIAGVLGILLVSALAGGGYIFYGRGVSKQIESIAVMPFVNDRGNADVEYLSDGMTETLIGSLSKIANLSVKARSAVFTYKGKDLSAKQIGDELGVQAVLLGTLVQRGENIRLNLELVNTSTQNVIWSEQYDRKQVDLVNLQSEIARDVSSKLRSKLSREDQQVLNKKYTDDPEAYRLYLQARFYLNKRVGKEYEKAEGVLQEAIERDPNFALGYTGLAEFIGQRDRSKAKEYITRALAIDDQLSEAHALLGFQYTLDRDWAMGERELTKAIELDSGNSRALQWNATRQLMLGHYDESLRTLDNAITIDPTIPDLRTTRSACLVAAGRVDQGISEIKTAIEIDPSYPWAFSQLSFIYRMTGDHAASVETRARSLELLGMSDVAAYLREAFAKGWVAYLHELLAQTTGNFSSPTRRASILSELGQKEEALAALDEAGKNGDWWLFSIKYDPAFDPLRGNPRFQALLNEFEPAH